MKTACFVAGLAWVAVVSGCGSQVVGGGGGAGGGGTTGGDGGAAATGPGGTTGGGASTAESTGNGGPASTTAGGGGANTLGECVTGGDVTVGTTGSSTFECSTSYTCEGGDAVVECLDDGTTATCDCFLDGELAGSCVEENDFGCSFPAGCCYALLGGTAQPNPGPYGTCPPDGASTSTTGVGPRESACAANYECDGGDLRISCEGPDGQDATCECRDGQGFLLATCQQPTVDCDYASGCCFDEVN